jgi:tetratricopeptide (TPR) repeat protein
MAISRAKPPGRYSQLWQLPLFVLSLALFIYAGYLFIAPGPGATIDQKIAVARDYLKQNRPDAALQQLSRILETEKPEPLKEGTIHLLIAEALEAGQKQLKIDVPANDQRIIEQTELAQQLGVQPDADMHRRVGDSYAALGHTADAAEHYRQAISLDPHQSLSLRRKLIDLELGDDDSANAEVSLTDYLKQPELTDAERAWALGQRAGILIDNKKFADARKLLADAARLDSDPVDQGTFNYQLGYCSYKEGLPDDAERYLRLSRDQLRVGHPLDADAAYYLGRIFQDRNDPATAISFYQDVLTSHPESRAAPLALLGRGICRIMSQQTDAGLVDFHDLISQIDRRPSRNKYKQDVLSTLADADGILMDRQDYQSALEVMADEIDVQPTPPPGFYARFGSANEKRAAQLEATIPDADAADKIRRRQEVFDLRNKAGDAYIQYSRQLSILDDHGYADALWKGVDPAIFPQQSPHLNSSSPSGPVIALHPTRCSASAAPIRPPGLSTKPSTFSSGCSSNIPRVLPPAAPPFPSPRLTLPKARPDTLARKPLSSASSRIIRSSILPPRNSASRFASSPTCITAPADMRKPSRACRN